MDHNEDGAWQLIYSSRQDQDLKAADIERILMKSRNFNERHKITGILVCTEDAFIQLLEGEDKIVNQLYQRISSDPRHLEPRVLWRGWSDVRIFSGWSMASASGRWSEIGAAIGIERLSYKTFCGLGLMDSITRDLGCSKVRGGPNP